MRPIKNALERLKRAIIPVLILSCAGSTAPGATGFAPLPPPKPAAPHYMHMVSGSAVSLPGQKPAVRRPDITQLLRYGMPPLPGRKPAAPAEIPAIAESPAPAPAAIPVIASVPPEAAAAPLPPKPPEAKQAAAVTAPPPAPAIKAEKPAGKEKPETPPRLSSTPLSKADAALYREIFAHQSRGGWDEASALMKKLKDQRLRGHVLAQRYLHPTAYKSSFEELAAWMDMYYDHPDADRIYRLALARKPAEYKGAVRKPQRKSGVNGFLNILFDQNQAYRSPKKRDASEKQAVSRLQQEVRHDISDGAPGRAYKRLLSDKAAPLLDRVENDELIAAIARGYMHEGNIKKAYEMARSSARNSGPKVPLAGWVAGLSAWRLGHYKEAASWFEITATSPYASSWTAAAGAYWASRAHMRAGRIAEVNPWLRQAAAHPRTFYGLIATRALGWDFDFNWHMPALTEKHVRELAALPAGNRAMALVAAGQYHLAERELRRIDPGENGHLLEALLAYADKSDLPYFAMRLAQAVPGPEGTLYDAALYPLCPWQPEGGYKIDRALIHALIRQESKFDPHAESHRGATGLMQIMPTTAGHVLGKKIFREAGGRHSLKDPQVNLDLGQRYVEELLGHDDIGTELFSLAIAYNAGPGNLRKWKRKYADLQDDPLLFVETIPIAETRGFVERVMANYWIYRLRLGQPTPSLDAVAEGRWAQYVGLDDKSLMKEAAASPGETRRFAFYRVAVNARP